MANTIFDLLSDHNLEDGSEKDAEKKGSEKDLEKEGFVPAGGMQGPGQMPPQTQMPPQGQAVPPQGMPPGQQAGPPPPKQGPIPLPPNIEQAVMKQMPAAEDSITLQREELRQILSEAIDAAKDNGDENGEEKSETKSEGNISQKLDQILEILQTLTELIAPGGGLPAAPERGELAGQAGGLGGLLTPPAAAAPMTAGEEKGSPPIPKLESDTISTENKKLLNVIQSLQESP